MIVITGVTEANATISAENGSEHALNVGVNFVTLTVTAADGVTEKRYLVVVTRLGEEDETTPEKSGTLTDSRDGKTYKWIRIGTQVWMAENLNFGTFVASSSNQNNAAATGAEKYCYDDNETHCNSYGGLYQWHSAMALPLSCNRTSNCVTIPSRGICPEGWHVPSNEDWAALDTWVDRDNDGLINGNAGTSLRSINAVWKNFGVGTDAYGWTALPGGYRAEGLFNDEGHHGIWWSASEVGADIAWVRGLRGGGNALGMDDNDKNNFSFSVRCVQD